MLKPGQKLADAYLKANLPVARERLYLAGMRLARCSTRRFLSSDADNGEATAKADPGAGGDQRRGPCLGFFGA